MQQSASPCVIMANEPRAYREVMTTAFRRLRPQLAILMVEPDALDDQMSAQAGCTRPLVVHSRRSAPLPTHVGASVLLYPDGEDWARVSLAGQHTHYSA